ncbi:MAG: trypsin-like peptidase domain-containing protein [Clostridia bacterium]|nr:trypsin-like peptidase domain-containing protein [Clostridia bacterium]
MDEFKWYNDDFQNNTNTSDSYAKQSFTQEPHEGPHRKKKSKKPKNIPAIVLSIILVGVIGVSGYFLAVPNDELVQISRELQDNLSSNSEEASGSTVQQLVTTTDGKVYSTPEIVDMVGPAVVGVVNKTTYTNPYGGMFGQMPNSSGEVEQGSGSGVIISADGYIVTNNHVIEGATEIGIILSNGEQYNAKLVGTDSRTDLAVVKIEASDLTYAKLGTSSELRVGDTAIAIGNPLGQEFAGTTTQGIISGLNRSVTIDNKTLNLIQTDAAINPGNSGGALVNNKGQVIGINTAKISSSQYEGLGFAIPIDDAKPIVEDLIANGYVKGRPVIGIGGRAVTERDAQAYDMKVGVYVVSMTADSPAYMAGIKIGDIITECQGSKIETVDDLNEIKNKHKVGDTLNLKVYRQGKTIDIKLILGEEAPTSQG